MLRKVTISIILTFFAYNLNAMNPQQENGDERFIYIRHINFINAVRFGNLEQIASIINTRLNFNFTDICGCSALYYAAYRGYKDIVKLLLINNANVNSKSFGGFTPLHAAVSQGHKEIVDLLLENGAKKNIKDAQGRIAIKLTSDLTIIDLINSHMFVSKR